MITEEKIARASAQWTVGQAEALICRTRGRNYTPAQLRQAQELKARLGVAARDLAKFFPGAEIENWK